MKKIKINERTTTARYNAFKRKFEKKAEELRKNSKKDKDKKEC